jgi:hypothetical protein
VEVNRNKEDTQNFFRAFNLVTRYLSKDVGSVGRPVGKVIELAVPIPVTLLVGY